MTIDEDVYVFLYSLRFALFMVMTTESIKRDPRRIKSKKRTEIISFTIQKGAMKTTMMTLTIFNVQFDHVLVKGGFLTQNTKAQCFYVDNGSKEVDREKVRKPIVNPKKRRRGVFV
jgi:hypothetical protein